MSHLLQSNIQNICLNVSCHIQIRLSVIGVNVASFEARGCRVYSAFSAFHCSDLALCVKTIKGSFVGLTVKELSCIV